VKPGRTGTIAAGLVLLGLSALSIAPPGPLPALGPFLDPAHGVFGVARHAEFPAHVVASIPGLAAPVAVRYDDRGVPHIFAGNESDLARALGYVVARDRLFQLELQARSGAGTLTGLLGPRALPLDREMRTLGLPDAAERNFATLPDTSHSRRLMEAYAAGVNAWIAAMPRAALPLEYRLLGRRPARWDPINVQHLFNRMGYVLTRSDLEARQARARRLVGGAAADALYPSVNPIQEPLQPNGRDAPRVVPGTVAPPGLPEETPVLGPAGGPMRPDELSLGSNNWAVAPRRSATGHALLAGDPHLELTLPSIWYEVHLVIPDSLDVYGVTIPGVPGVVIGFTRQVAWSFTNVEADLQDRWVEVVDDPERPSQYRLDGAWRPLRKRVERYLGPAGELLREDTLRFTHRGPLSRGADGRWISLRWTVLEAAPTVDAMARAARASTLREWLAVMEAWAAPPQNMLVADRRGTIAIRSTGRFPIRPTGRGDLLLRGDTSATDWGGDWPLSKVPQAIAPPQGYLASANQQPIDPAEDPTYLGANWYSPWRALRINELLRADDSVTVDAMRRYQTDPVSAAAQYFVPAFLAAARRAQGGDTLARAAALLAEWDLSYHPDNRRAVLFEAALEAMLERLWDELTPTDSTLAPAPRPGQVIAWKLLDEPESPWWDVRATPRIETRDDILVEALLAAYEATVAAHGPPEGDGWRWGNVKRATITHMLRIPALSATDIEVPGGTGTITPLSDGLGFGSSWRMVVELGDTVRGFGTYPGGQSGNPASRRYLDRLPLWTRGELAPLHFPASAEAMTDAGPTLELVPGP